MSYLKYKIIILLVVVSLAAFAQKDTSKAIVKKDSTDWKHLSIKGKVFISAGIGQSTILIGLYSSPGGNEAKGTSQSLVYNGTVDYGIKDKMTLGLGVAYQTATGIPAGQYTVYGFTENLTRLNIAARVLWVVRSTKATQIYMGFRCGVSYWTDIITPTPSPMAAFGPYLGENHVLKFPSIQIPVGIRTVGNLALHFELAIGTPYFGEVGLTARF
jgi:hypothetical protein